MELFRVQMFIDNDHIDTCDLLEVGVFSSLAIAKDATETFKQVRNASSGVVLTTQYELDKLDSYKLVESKGFNRG